MTELIDTPDYQFGIVNPQVELAAVPANTTTVNVVVPPNAETLIVTSQGSWNTTPPVVVGLTTGISYPGVPLFTPGNVFNRSTYVFDASSVTDAVVEVNAGVTFNQKWYVYADSGVHITVDASKAANQIGMAYVIPVAPGNVSGDHPPVELQQYANNGQANTALVVPAPPALSRLRIFYATVTPESAGAVASLVDPGTGNAIASMHSISGGQPQNMDYKPSGFPLSQGNGVQLFVTAGTATVGVVYTHEAV